MLAHDLVATVGDQGATLEEAVARLRLLSPGLDDFEHQVVDDVQQFLHDTFVDTTWPACPEHPNHPLWYSDGWWRCEQSGTRVARLGRLTRGLD